MSQLIGVAIGLGVAAVMLLIVFIKANLVICQPNEVIIISGRRRKRPDGSTVGYRVIKGGRGFKMPIVERVSSLPLTTISIDIRLHKALCSGVIPINVDGRANLKIAGTEDAGLSNAIERFLGRKVTEISAVAKETIEGSLRGVLATVTPEEANAQRLAVAERVAETASKDLAKLGLVLDFVKIQDISDEQGYLEAIGRRKNAEVLKEARIAEASAESAARVFAAEQKRKSQVAEAEAEMAIAESQKALEKHVAELAAATNEASERAKVAGEIARVEEEQRLEGARVERNRRKHEADVVIPAEAARRAAEMRAAGEAATVRENGRATAEAIELMREQWQDGDARDLFVIRMLPELVEKVTDVVADNLHIDRVTVLDSGNGNGVSSHVKNLTNSATVVLEQLKNSLGLDLPGLLQTHAKANGSQHVVELPNERV